MDEMMRGQRSWRELAALGDKINKFTGMIEGLIWSPRCGGSHEQPDDWAFEEALPTIYVSRTSCRHTLWIQIGHLVSRHSSSLMESPGEFPTQKDTSKNFSHEASVVFVLGGPASGKGTQCPKIVEHFGFTHLCVGELLEAETKSGSENGKMIRNFKLEGKIVPSEVTVGILQQAMQQSENKKFIIDGFPRNEENLATFEKTVKVEPEFVLFFDCPEEELKRRLLNRNQGRADDNPVTIEKRLKVFKESTLPVINYYSSKGKVQKINAQRSVEQVFEDIKNVFSKLNPGSKGASTI